MFNSIKLHKNKNSLIALFTSLSLFSIPTVAFASRSGVDAYYDDTSFNITETGSYTLSISKKRLDELINSSNEQIIVIEINGKETKIDRDELIKLKEKAEQYEKENAEYVILFSLIGGVVITSIVVKDYIKEKVKK